MALFAMVIFTGLTISMARAGSLLDEMQVPDTCGTTYADNLATCTPFNCSKPSLMAAMSGAIPKDVQAKLEKHIESLSSKQRAAMKAKMTSSFEIKGLDAQGRCQIITMAVPGQRMDCNFDKSVLQQVSEYSRLIAKATDFESDSTSHLVNGKMVTESTVTIDGVKTADPWTTALSNGQCSMMVEDADVDWVSMSQMNRMSHFEFNLLEHGKHVDGHIQILNSANGKILFDKDVETSYDARKINLQPGTFDIKVVSMNPQLSPVWFRGVKLGEANVFSKNVEFYAVSGTLKLTVNLNGKPSRGAAIYIKDPDTKKRLGKWGVRKKATYSFVPASIELPETLTGRYHVFVAAAPTGLSVPKHATYKDFFLTIKNGETVEKTINFGVTTTARMNSDGVTAGKTLSHLVPLQLYWSGKNQDNFVTATRKGADEALAAGYRFARTEACVTAVDTKPAEQSLGSRALKLFWSPNRGDHFSAASSRGEQDAMAAGYKFVRAEGFILPSKQPGTVPLKLYWNSSRKDNFSTATLQGAHDAEAAGYRFSRIQGYVYPASKCQRQVSEKQKLPVSTAPVERSTQKGQSTLFILDASGSMWGQIKGKPKITIAKEVMAKLVPELPDNARIGLIAYGHRRKGDCNDVETLVRPGAGNKKAVLNAVKGLNAKGKTPLTRSVNQAFKMLQSEKQTSTIILVSDGIESCNANPCETVKAAKKHGVNFILHTVGFGLSKKESAQLQCMAKAGGGEYFQANNAEELLKSARKAIQPMGVVKLTVKLNGKVNDLMYRVEAANTGKIIQQPVLPTASGMAIRLPSGRYNVFVSPAGVSGAGERKLSLNIKTGETIERTLAFGKGVLHLTVMVNDKPAHAYIHMEDSATHKGVYESSVFGWDTPLNIDLASGKVDVVVRPDGRNMPEQRVNGVEIMAGKTTELVIPVEMKPATSTAADANGME